MTEKESAHRSAGGDTVQVSVTPETAPRLRAGTRWEVVATSLDSLWNDRYTVTLRAVQDRGGAGGPE